MKKLPNEIWLIIIDELGNQGQLRDMTNLIRAIRFSNNIGDKYRALELNKSRYNFDPIESYNDKMIKLWERTGIDDGVPPYYLIKRLNNKTRMYRTIWSYDVFKNINGKYNVLKDVVFDICNGSNDYKRKYTDGIIVDKRNKPFEIEKSWYHNYSDKTIKKINNSLVNFSRRKMIHANNYPFNIMDYKTR